MEIFFKADPVSGVGSGGGVAEGASAFFTFRDLKLRDQVASMLLEQLGVSTSFLFGWFAGCVRQTSKMGIVGVSYRSFMIGTSLLSYLHSEI